MRVVLRIAAGVLGCGSALVALLLPVLAYVNVAAESGWRQQHPAYFWGGVAYVGVTIFAMALFAGVSYALLRYAAGVDVTAT